MSFKLEIRIATYII